MNDTVTIYALALASNSEAESNFKIAFEQISLLGRVKSSRYYLIPCREAKGQDYWNAACLLFSTHSVEEIVEILKEIETKSGRIRPSHKISLDVDLIAWGKKLSDMQFNPKKLPLALDVKIPMYDLWQAPNFEHHSHQFPVIKTEV